MPTPVRRTAARVSRGGPAARPSRSIVAAAAGVVVLVVLVALAVPLLVGRDSDDPPPGVALSSEDRAALDAVAVQRGEPAAEGGEAAVAMDDPDAVVRAYLTAAHTITTADAGQTHLRATRFAAPGSTPAQVGVVVLDAPPPGRTRLAVVAALELVVADPTGSRRAYRAEIDTVLAGDAGPTGDVGRGGAPDGQVDLPVVDPAGPTVIHRDVAVARQPDGRWLVTADTPAQPDLPAGED